MKRHAAHLIILYSLISSIAFADMPLQWIISFDSSKSKCDPEILLEKINSHMQGLNNFELLRPYSSCGIIVTGAHTQSEIESRTSHFKTLPGFKFIEADQVMTIMSSPQ